MTNREWLAWCRARLEECGPLTPASYRGPYWQLIARLVSGRPITRAWLLRRVRAQERKDWSLSCEAAVCVRALEQITGHTWAWERRRGRGRWSEELSTKRRKR